MEVDESLITFILTTYYNMTPIVGSIKQLCGYSDRNYSFVDSTSSDNKMYVLKIVNKDESDPNLTAIIDEILDNAYEFRRSDHSRLLFVVPKLIRTTANKLSTFTHVKHRIDGDMGAVPAKGESKTVRTGSDDSGDESDYTFIQCNLKLCEYFDGITLFDLINRHPSKYKAEELYTKLGRMANQLFRFFRAQGYLLYKLKSVRNAFAWQLIGSEEITEQNLGKLYPQAESADRASATRRLLVEKVLADYRRIKPELANLPEFIFHSDLCNRNILVEYRKQDAANKMCLIDFQDLQVGPQVAELAILMLYNVLEQEIIPFEKALKLVPKWILTGYQSSGIEVIQVDHVRYIPVLMKLRLIQSLINGQLAFKEAPKNDYVMHTNQRGWQLLELMMTEDVEKKLEKKLIKACKTH